MNDSLPRRLTVFATDFPFPPNRGGRADVWRRIVAMKRLGIAIQLFCFFDDLPHKRPTDVQSEAVLAQVSELHALPIHKGLLHTVRRLAILYRLPWHAACRTLDDTSQVTVDKAVKAFDPCYIWLEGPWCGVSANLAAEHAGKPVIYRSHNVEHLYMRRQAKAARSIRDRLAWTIACTGLKRFEIGMITRSQWIFDISFDDMRYWSDRGVDNIRWLPPLAEACLLQYDINQSANSPSRDVVFLGNLTTPNNIRGVEWLMNDIAPLVRTKHPNSQFLIAGSNPGEYVKSLCRATGALLIENPDDALSIYRNAGVLVNPVRTGSGTQLKAIEMLMTSRPIVTTLQGTSGMPDELRSLFRVANSAQSFADHIVEALDSPHDCQAERAVARRYFGIQELDAALQFLVARHK